MWDHFYVSSLIPTCMIRKYEGKEFFFALIFLSPAPNMQADRQKDSDNCLFEE